MPWLRLSHSGRLEDVGRGVGLRLLETLCHRERGGKRDTRLLDVLKFVHTTLWKYLFGRQARDLEQSNAVRCRIQVHCPLCLWHPQNVRAARGCRGRPRWTMST